jgi:chemotaxis protein MotB
LSKRSLQRSPENGGGNAAWLTTFNDLMTLLMVFFVLIFTMGSMDNNRMGEFLNSLQSGLGVLGAGTKVAISVHPPRTPILQQGQTTRKNHETGPENEVVETESIGEVLDEFAAHPGINVRYSKEGVHVSFENGLFFNFGKADINTSGFAFLEKMALSISKYPYAVRVEGHTDNVPIHTNRFPTNWELSIARAVSVVKYLVDVGNINPQRLSAVGYGESRPLVPNSSPANLAKNRRVEIVLATEDEK